MAIEYRGTGRLSGLTCFSLDVENRNDKQGISHTLNRTNFRCLGCCLGDHFVVAGVAGLPCLCGMELDNAVPKANKRLISSP